jgi:hypothetical protein
MSANTRSLSLSLLVSLIAAGAVLAEVVPPPLPPAIAGLTPSLKVRGGGELKFLGLSIYDGYYYCPGDASDGWSPNVPFALQLVYHRHLRGVRIAERSIDEIVKLGYGTAEQRARWGEQMRRIFVDVEEGDEITGLNVPQRGVRYFHNGKPIGDIDDPEFARAFFGIWLDPNTSEPALRKKLLAQP